MAEPRRAIIEIRRFGQAVKVTAVDSVTLVEVSLQAPAATPESTLRSLVLQKLERAIAREGRQASSTPENRAPGAARWLA